MAGEANATYSIQILIALDLAFCALAIFIDIWSLYLETHLSSISRWVNKVETIVEEPTGKIFLIGHLILCFIQCLVLFKLYNSGLEKKLKHYIGNFKILLFLVGVEYAIFLGYLVGTWNHYLYVFITYTFIALSYKTILFWPLQEFKFFLVMYNYPQKDSLFASNFSLYQTPLISAEFPPSIDNNLEMPNS